jgi:hypothetical protein
VISWIRAPKVSGAQLPVPASLNGWKGRLARFVRVLGPYAAIELLLPGGSLIALCLWLYKTHRMKPLLGSSALRGTFWRRRLWPRVSPAGNYA